MKNYINNLIINLDISRIIDIYIFNNYPLIVDVKNSNYKIIFLLFSIMINSNNNINNQEYHLKINQH